MKDRANQTFDPESQREIRDARRDAAEEWNRKWLKLNRAWMHPLDEGDEVSEINLHLMPRELFWRRRKAAISQWAWNNAFSQWGVRRTFRLLGKICNLLVDISRRFDEDSPSNAYLKRKIESLRNTQYRFLMRSNRLIQERQEGAKMHRFNKVIDKAFETKARVIRELNNLWEQLTKKKTKEAEDPFTKWDQSSDKVEIIVMWRVIDGKDEKLGMLDMDIDAPANVAREYCRRFLREELNAKSGELFLMMAKGEGLPLMEESNKRIGQLAPQKFNSSTREIEHTLLLVENKDPNLEKKQIPIIKSEALKQAEKQMDEKRAKR